MDDETIEAVEVIIPGNEISWLDDKEGYFIEERDGHGYHVVRIGNQIWMITNLAFKPDSGNYWAYNNDQNNISKYGYLYDWETAQIVCPRGWKLPTKSDFETLLKNFDNSTEAAYDALIQGGSSGFSVHFGGRRNEGGSFINLDYRAYFWSASAYNTTHAYYLDINNKYGKEAEVEVNNKGLGFSIRCLQNN